MKEIPENWEVRRLKFLCHITTGAKNTEDKVQNGKYPFFVRSQILEKINTYSYDGEAILTASDGAGVGKVFHYINGKFDYHQRVYKFSNDLSTYGLERTKLNESISLDSEETELDPQNPNPRRAHEGEEENDPLDLIIQSFNERWFSNWDATPEEQRVKFVLLAKHIRDHPNFAAQVVNNPDPQNADLALLRMIDDAIRQQRRKELDMYKLYSQDEGFRQAMRDTLRRILGAV